MLSLEKIYQAIRDSLFIRTNKEFLIFLFFLALSGIFWLMMTLNGTYEKEYPVAMHISGVPKNVVITTPASDTVRVTVRDKGFVLLSYNTSNRLHPIVVNFATYANKQTGKGQIPLAEVQKQVRQQLSASSTLSSVKADHLDFYFNYGRNKEVTITLSGNIVPAKNYYLAHSEFSPEKVTVYASKTKLDSIKTIPTEYLNITNFDDTVVKTVRLKAIQGVKVVPETVKLTLYPDILTEETVEVPITAINKPDGLVIRTFPQRVKVKFTVGAKLFRLIQPSDFQVVVDYKEIAAHPANKCNLYLHAKPHFVSNASIEMAEVDYLIEQR